MTIGKKLYLGFGVLSVLVVVLWFVNMTSYWTQSRIGDDTQNAVEALRAIEKLRYQIMQNRVNLGTYLLSGSSPDLATFESGRTAVHGLAQEAIVKAVSDRQRQALNSVERFEQNWYETFALPLIERRKKATGNNLQEFNTFYLSQDPAALIEKSNTQLDEAGKADQDVLTQLRNEDHDADQKAIWIGFTTLGLIIVGGVLAAALTSRSITRPLGQLMTITREISETGDLEQSFAIDSNDEVGALAANFKNMVSYLREMATVSESIAGGDLTAAIKPRSKHDTLSLAIARMTENLRSMVKSVRDSATQVASGSGQVADTSDSAAKVSVQASSAIDEVTSTMHEMSVNVQNMVKNTQTQALSVSETSASIDEMVASIQRVADTSKMLLDISQRSREEVHQGITTMEKTTDGLSRINASIQSAGQIIDALGKRADSIGNIVEVIDDLAEQTNLLALNAAIEAARAGEHGSGFAVVADEVRKLAEKSAASAKEISDLIASIQNEARQAVDKMEKSTNIVNEGLAFGNDLQSALKKISYVVTEVYKYAQEIGAATSEQSHGSTQIAKATTRLNEITHEINSSVEEQAAGAQAVVRAMEKMRELIAQNTSGSTELASSAEQMSKMSRNLLETMDRFVLEISGNGSGAYRPRSEAETASYATSAKF